MERDLSIDIMKGIGICAVIAGHTFLTSNTIHNLIYSFHMPLFFILSGYFYKRDNKIIQKMVFDGRRIIIPYILTSLFLIIFLSYRSPIPQLSLKYGLLAIIWGSGGTHTSLFFSSMPKIGPLWFLPALFWCRTIYNTIVNKCKFRYTISLCVAVIAILIDRYVISLPFCILPGLSAITFYMIGNYINKHSINKLLIILCCLCWFIQLHYFGIDMCVCMYKCYPIDILAGCFSTTLIYIIAKCISHHIIGRVISSLGKMSLTILCFHTLEFFIIDYSTFIPNAQNEVILFLSRSTICILFAYIWNKGIYVFRKFTTDFR